MINTVFYYALDEKLILKQIPSPMISVVFEKGDEKVPDILTLTEMKLFLSKAKEYDSKWYPVWATALLTGMRNGELYALEWTDLDFENLQIKVSRSYDIRTDRFKSTKAGYWRTVPISSDLLQLFKELKVNLKFREPEERKFVLPRLGYWNKGLQARELRSFLKLIGIRSVKFHALRACFATQLLVKKVPPAIVMKICGWKNLKTMEYYVRLAGVDEAGATEVLDLLPMEVDPTANVVSLFP